MLRMRWQTGVVHSAYPRMRRQKLGERLGVGILPGDAKGEGLEATNKQVGDKGSTMAPVTARRLRIPSTSSADPSTAPASRSLWPPRYLVAECSTRSMPNSSGR